MIRTLIRDEDVHPDLRWFAASVLRTACDDLGLDEHRIDLRFFRERPDSDGLVTEGACADGKSIFISDSLDVPAVVAVVAHESRHAQQHARLGPTRGDADRELREADAESYAARVMGILGFRRTTERNGHG